MTSEYTSPAPPLDVSARELTPTFASITVAQSQFQETRRDFAVDSALGIAPITQPLIEPLEAEFDADRLNETASVTERELHRIRKVADVYEDVLKIRLPTGSLYRAIRTMGTVSSIGGILIALSGLNDAATSIEETYSQGGKKAVELAQADDFYFASGVFIGELVLLATPFAGDLAFRTTGRFHSRLLWHRFGKHRAEYRLLLHHIYYLVKGVPSLVLHNFQDGIDTVSEFVESIVFIVNTTWEAFEEPRVIKELRSHDLSLAGSVIGGDFSIDGILDGRGDIRDRIEQYIRDIIADIRAAYDGLYREYLNVSGIDEIVRKIVERIIVRYIGI